MPSYVRAGIRKCARIRALSQLGINYKNLSDEEFRWLIRILKKSKKMGTPISQRKKR